MREKVVVITGSTSGIGKALAFEFGRQGSRVIINGRKADTVAQTLQHLRAQGIVCDGHAGDVSSEHACRELVEMAVARFGRIDVLINNAGITMRALFEELKLDVFKKVLDINFFGTVYTTRYAIGHILASKGSIVGISSINGRRSTPARTAYSASKFAMEGFLESLRTEVMNRGVHVLTVCPGFTSSNIRQAALTATGESQGESPRDEKDMMTAEEAAAHIYKAVVKRRRDLVLTAQGKAALWLNKFFPSLMDRITYRVMAHEPDSPLK